MAENKIVQEWREPRSMSMFIDKNDLIKEILRIGDLMAEEIERLEKELAEKSYDTPHHKSIRVLEREIEEVARAAKEWHAEAGSLYGEESYGFHLEQVYRKGLKYRMLLSPGMEEACLKACWLHDVLEECYRSVTWDMVSKLCGEQVANITLAVTQEPGGSPRPPRSSRVNDVCYKTIAQREGATFVKLCDRLANVEHCVKTGDSRLNMYYKEHAEFKKHLYREEHKIMWQELKELFEMGVKHEVNI